MINGNKIIIVIGFVLGYVFVELVVADWMRCDARECQPVRRASEVRVQRPTTRSPTAEGRNTER